MRYNPLKTAWFWLLFVAVVLIILAITSYEVTGGLSDNSNTTPWWIWIVAVLGAIFFFSALCLYCVWKYSFTRAQKCCKTKLQQETIAVVEETEDDCFHPNFCKDQKDCAEIVGRKRY